MDDSCTPLRVFRLAHGLTLTELGERLGVTRQAVSNWEQGVAVPGGPAIRLLAQVFGIQPEAVNGWFNKETAGRG